MNFNNGVRYMYVHKDGRTAEADSTWSAIRGALGTQEASKVVEASVSWNTFQWNPCMDKEGWQMKRDFILKSSDEVTGTFYKRI